MQINKFINSDGHRDDDDDDDGWRGDGNSCNSDGKLSIGCFGLVVTNKPE